MSILRNNTAHIIIVGGTMLIPGRVTPDVDDEKLGGLYPELKQMINKGDISVITTAQAKAIEADFEERSIADLKDYAKEHGINIDGLKKKADIVAVIKAEDKGRKGV